MTDVYRMSLATKHVVIAHGWRRKFRRIGCRLKRGARQVDRVDTTSEVFEWEQAKEEPRR